MKRFFLVSMFMAIFAVASVNAQPNDKITGVWKTTTVGVEVDGEEIMTMQCDAVGIMMQFTFNSDMTGYAYMETAEGSESTDFIYEVEDNTIYMTETETYETIEIKISGSKLYLEEYEDGMLMKMYLEKQ